MTYQESSDGSVVLCFQTQRDAEMDQTDGGAEQEHILGSDILPHLSLIHILTIKLDYDLPEYPKMESCYRRAPRRESHLTEADKALAIKNALRYIHPDHHEQMAKEFAAELEEHGRIYGYRFRPEGKL